MRLLMSALVLMVAALVPLSRASAQQLTDAQVIATCVQTKALPDNSWSYKIAHTGWADLQWGVQNPFPGRQPGDVRVEITAAATPTFNCTPADAQGQNPQNLATFGVNAPVRGFFVGTDDILACQRINGISTMVYVFVGQPCPFSTASGFPNATVFTGTGPYGTKLASTQGTGLNCTVYYPAVWELNVRHPIVLFGPGNTLDIYDALLDYWSSHGFVVVAPTGSSVTNGAALETCLDTLLNDSLRADSLFLRKINPYRVAAVGHGLGGNGALMIGRSPRVMATAATQPYPTASGYSTTAPSAQQGPMLLLSGGVATAQTSRADQQGIFNAANVPTFWATEKATSSSTQTIGMARQIMPFLRWQLMGDTNAANFFTGPCTTCNDTAWTVEKKGL